MGILCPLLVAVSWLWAQGVFERFWFWTFSYAKAYVSIVPLNIGLLNARRGFGMLFQSAPLLLVLATLGFIGIFAGKLEQKKRLFLEAWLLLAFLSICPGFYFRQHYFVPLLPILCVLIGMAIEVATAPLLTNPPSRVVPVLIGCVALLACFQSLYNHHRLYFQMPPAAASRAQYGFNPFPESLTVSRYIEQHTRPEDRIAILGSEPQIYFYSHRHSATGYIYTYPLMEHQPFARKMQADMIGEIEREKPVFIVFVAVPTSWLIGPGAYHDIFDWFKTYREQWFDEVAMMPILEDVNQSSLIIQSDTSPVDAVSSYYLRIYKRKKRS